MNRLPILHIGYPKTATSFFQQYYYPKVENINYANRKKVQELITNPGAFSWDLVEAKKYFLNQKDKEYRWVICEELLSGRLRPGGLKGFLTKAFAERLKAVFPEANVVIFVRNQLDALVSAYSEYLRAGGNYSIRHFIKPEGKFSGQYNDLVLMQAAYFNYYSIIKLYKELFGEDRVFIFCYEEFAENPQSFLEKYSKLFHFSVQDATPPLFVNRGIRKGLVMPRRLANSFSRKGPLFKYYFIHIPGADKLVRYAFQRINRIPVFGNTIAASNALPQDIYKELYAYYANCNNKIRTDLGMSQIEKYNYPLLS